jgi:uncharacterized protein involved in exopolysaccharide biosynthesis
VAFTAVATFVPEGTSQTRLPAGLAGFAGQFGITLGGDGAHSPKFYADVLRSDGLMRRVLLARYPYSLTGNSAQDSVRLLDVLLPRPDDRARHLDKGLRALRQRVSTRVDAQTNIVRLAVEAPQPELAAAVANRFIEYLNDFNAQSRQSQARLRRSFVEKRLVSGELELRHAEEELKTFYERNRSWQQSPQLVFEEGRLRREVEVRQEVHVTLMRELETARIQEVNDAPIITVIDLATPSRERSRPKRRQFVALALLLGAIVGLSLALAAEYVERIRRVDPQGYRELRGLARGMWIELRTLRRWLPSRAAR